MRKRKPSSRAWIIKNILYPLAPFLIELLLNWIIKGGRFQLDFLNTVTLTISLGVLCLFVSHSLTNLKNSLDHEQNNLNLNDREEIPGDINIFNIGTFIYVSLFSALIVIQALIKYHEIYTLYSVLNRFNVVVLFLIIPPIFWAVKTQKAYKLKAG